MFDYVLYEEGKRIWRIVGLVICLLGAAYAVGVYTGYRMARPTAVVEVTSEGRTDGK